MNILTNSRNNELFTDLTSDDAAVIEGGFQMRLHSLYASSLTYDDRNKRPVAYEPALYVNGRKKLSWKALRKGKAIPIRKTGWCNLVKDREKARMVRRHQSLPD